MSSLDSPVKRVLYNEISFIIALIGAVSALILWISDPQKNLQIKVFQLEAKLEANETIAVKLEQIKNNDIMELHLSMQRIEERQLDLIKAIARLEAKIK